MKKRWLLALAGLVCGLYLATLRPGQGWMDDYAQYALHAANLAEGRPYEATGYIFNPAYPYTGPATYPPVFPLLLAAVYRFAGPDLRAMKAVTVVFFSATLCVLALLFSAALPGRLPLLLAGLLGLNPVFWKFKDYLYSEYVFMFFSFSALLAFAGARAAEASGESWRPKALAAGLLLYLAYGTRSAGALTGLAFAAFDLLNGRKPSKTLLAACGAALCLGVLQNFTLHSDAVYVEQARSWFAGTPFLAVLANNLRNYPGRFVQLFHNGYLEPPAWALFGTAALLAAAGFLARVKEKIALPEIYAAINLLFLLVCPAADGLRYGFPLVPFFFYYAFAGWRTL
ncbi:MAG: hypothetical protein HY550_09165, partial [Elusimicrobia bacterium]|nr:hypothetical protein [Elusimicrobiota bacterium]